MQGIFYRMMENILVLSTIKMNSKEGTCNIKKEIDMG